MRLCAFAALRLYRMAGIYIHIPFCRKKCRYCDFPSSTELFKADEFLKVLTAEFRTREKGIKKFDTLYVGGGTPSVLETRQLEKLFLSITGAFGEIKKFREATVEINPESAAPEKLKLIKAAGVNRLSAGLQSTDPARLRFLGRLASYPDFLKTYKAARKAGFGNINADLIYGIPGQTRAEFRKDLERLTDLRPEHISAYCLEIHEGTPLGKLNPEQDEGEAADMYYELINFLERKNYLHYEISNFALKGRESVHNLNYWDRGAYLGFGPSAASHYKNTRWTNTPSLEKYLKSMKRGRHRLFLEKLSRRDVLNERLILGLRKINGIELDGDIIIKFNDRLEKLAEKGFLEFCQGNKPVAQAAFVAKSRILKASRSDAKRGRSCNLRHLLRQKRCSAFSTQTEQPHCGPKCRLARWAQPGRLCRRPKSRDCSRIGVCATGLKVRIKKNFLFVSNSILSELIEA